MSMSKLSEMIATLCPNGVEYKKLGEVVRILRGKRLTKDMLSNENPYPVYHGGLEPLGYYSESNRDGDTVMIINVGASAGTVGYSSEKFWSSDGCFCLSHTDEAVSRYFYYVLQSKEDLLKGKVRVAGIPTLDSQVIYNLLIPLPPLPIQREVVKVLDNFAQLTAELTLELAKRKKQYEHYRDMLLNFTGGGINDSYRIASEKCKVEWKRLGEICISVSSGGTPKAGKQEYYDGDIPWLRTQEVNWDEITETSMKITQEGLENSSAKWIKPNCVIVAMYGATAGKVAINKIPLTTNQACCNLEIDPSKAIYRYVFHWLCHSYCHLT